MKKLIFLAVLLTSTLTFAHEKNKVEKKEMYNVIKTQLDKGVIDIETAQKMWADYIKCCS